MQLFKEHAHVFQPSGARLLRLLAEPFDQVPGVRGPRQVRKLATPDAAAWQAEQIERDALHQV